MECEICLSKLTKINTSVDCYLCNKKSCKKCIRQWSKERLQCSCCSCNSNWSITFIHDKLGLSFLNYFKKIQKNLLLKTELSFIPDTTRFLSLEKEYYKNTSEYNFYHQLLSKCKYTSSKELKEKYTHLDVFKNQKFSKIKLIKHVEGVKNMYYKLASLYYRAYIRGDLQCLNEIQNENIKKMPVFKCSGVITNDHEKIVCKGYVQSESGDCVVCGLLYCLKCYELKLDEHVCESQNVESVNAIIKDSKPCPQCGTRISKIDGCYAESVMIPLLNGQIKSANEIKAGDELIGDDYSKRTVISTVKGTDYLYDIVQTYACTYRVNSRHSLALFSRGRLFTLTVDQYLSLPENQQRLMFTYKVANNMITMTPFSVKPAGRGSYYGFLLDKNNQFLLTDFSVVRNCDQMYCTQCNTAWSWKTGVVETGRIHNPHYYEQLRNQGASIVRENQVNLEDNLDDELFITLANEVITNMGRNGPTREEMDIFMDVYVKYLHNYNILLNNTNQYSFKTNYLDRLLYIKNKITEQVFIKRCYHQFKNIQHKQELIEQVSQFVGQTKKILIRVIKCFYILHNSSEILQTKTDIINLYHEYTEFKKQFVKQIHTINNAYKNNTLSKIFIIE